MSEEKNTDIMNEESVQNTIALENSNEGDVVAEAVAVDTPKKDDEAFSRFKSKALAILRKYMMVIALVVVFLIFNKTTDGNIFLAASINNLIAQQAYVFVLSAGMLLCILTGGNIDLACGSVVCFSGAIGAVLMDKGVNMWIAVAVMLVSGTLVGIWQGFWIAYFRVPPFIATLAGMYAFRGLSNIVLKGYAVSVENEKFLKYFGGGADCFVPDYLKNLLDAMGCGADNAVTRFLHITGMNYFCLAVCALIIIVYIVIIIKNRVSAVKRGYEVENIFAVIAKAVLVSAAVGFLFYKLANHKGIPTVLIWIAIVLVAYAYITGNTAIGRYLYAVGGNEKATRLSGVDPRKVYLFAYINMGLMAGLAGIINIARFKTAQATFGQAYEMDAIAACFIGGASAFGGEGTVFGAIVGALLMGVINQGMLLMDFPTNYQKVVKGLVLLFAIIFDVLTNKKKN